MTDQFLSLMLDPFVYGRAGGFGPGGGAIGFAPEQEATLPPDIALAYSSILAKAPSAPTAAAKQRDSGVLLLSDCAAHPVGIGDGGVRASAEGWRERSHSRCFRRLAGRKS